VIPLHDDQPTNSFPLVTVILIVLNVLIYGVEQVVPGFTQSYCMVPFEVTHHQALHNVVAQITPYGTQLYRASPGTPITLGPHDIYYGISPRPLWLTIFTAMFLHANLLHIGGNMLFLWIFGNNVEDALGRFRYLIFYFVCGWAAAMIQIGSAPNSLIPTLGASGAIAGVLGAYLVLYPNARVWSLVPFFFYFLAPIRAFWVIIVWVIYDILPAFFNPQGVGGVAYFAHLGGFAAGFLLIHLLGGRRLAFTRRR
jgi:membrane associated rhomboid family serine protease